MTPRVGTCLCHLSPLGTGHSSDVTDATTSWWGKLATAANIPAAVTAGDNCEHLLTAVVQNWAAAWAGVVCPVAGQRSPNKNPKQLGFFRIVFLLLRNFKIKNNMFKLKLEIKLIFIIALTDLGGLCALVPFYICP